MLLFLDMTYVKPYPTVKKSALAVSCRRCGYFIFAVSLGLTWLATVPPTAATVGKLYGVKYLATLFGLVLFSHQVGGFLGAYLGGIVVDKFGNYQYMWYADMALAALAAVLNLPIQEPKIMKATS